MTLALERLSVRYGDLAALNDVSLTLPGGEVLAVLGPSGCGKSTLLRAVAGLERPVAGRVLLDGTDVTGVPVHRRGFALMFQDGQLFPQLSAGGNVAYPLRLRRVPRRERTARVAELLALVGLPGAQERDVTTLSGGERQRVALARALAVRPRLLLLDEPLSALDRDLRERLAADLRSILTAAATTAVLVTHDHDEAFAVADRIAVLRAGRLVQAGAAAAVWAAPADPDTARFLGYARVLPPEVARWLTGHDGPVALRRSALVVDPAGALTGVVRELRSTPEQARLVVEVTGPDRTVPLEAVAPLGVPLAPGQQVRLRLDRSRVAPLASHPKG